MGNGYAIGQDIVTYILYVCILQLWREVQTLIYMFIFLSFRVSDGYTHEDNHVLVLYMFVLYSTDSAIV